MPRVSEMLESKYLKKDDVGGGQLWTVKGFKRVNVAQEGEPPEMKWVMFFMEHEKPLVMNSTNIQLAEKVFGSDNTDDWIGNQIVLYVDENVSFGGKIVGGIRLRARRNKAPDAPKQPTKHDTDAFGDDIPF